MIHDSQTHWVKISLAGNLPLCDKGAWLIHCKTAVVGRATSSAPSPDFSLALALDLNVDLDFDLMDQVQVEVEVEGQV